MSTERESNFSFWHDLVYGELIEIQVLAEREGDHTSADSESPKFNTSCLDLFAAAQAKVEERYGKPGDGFPSFRDVTPRDVAGSPKQTHERLTLIEVKVGARGNIEQAKREMAILSKRLGIAVHAEINDELCLATPEDESARVYMKKTPAKAEPKEDPEWETLYCVPGSRLERWVVAGGWIYRSTQWRELDYDDNESDSERTESSVFVARP